MKAIEISNKQTMSSLEIARITSKQHKHVLFDCEKLNEQYRKMTLAEITADLYNDKYGRKQKCLYLTKIQTLDLITGYDIQMRIRVNRRWEQLEMQLNNPFGHLKPKVYENSGPYLKYIEMLEHLGYSIRSGSVYKRMKRYPNEFRRDGRGIIYCSYDLCMIIKKNKEVFSGRRVIADRNPRFIEARQMSLFNQGQMLSLFDDVMQIEDHTLRTRIAGKIKGEVN